jgi:hypothetical protein
MIGVLSVPSANAPVLKANRPVPSIPTKVRRESAGFTKNIDAADPDVELYTFANDPVTLTLSMLVGFVNPIPTFPAE